MLGSPQGPFRVLLICEAWRCLLVVDAVVLAELGKRT